MTRERLQYREPYGRADWQLVRGTDGGVCWRAENGLTVQLAAPERQREAKDPRLGEADALEAEDGIFAR
jgi:hypothetical protein